MSSVSDSTSYSQLQQSRLAAQEQERATARANQDKEIERIKNSYEKEVKNLKDDYHEQFSAERADAEKEVRRLKNELYDQKGKTAEQAQNQEHEFHHEVESLTQENEKKIEREQKKGTQSHEQLYQQNQEAIHRTLAEKDSQYQQYLRENKKNHEQQLQTLNEKIKNLETTSDQRELSPQAVNKIETTLQAKHQKELENTEAVNQKNLQAVRDRDAEEKADLRNQFNKKQFETNRTGQKNLDMEKKQLIASYQDLQFSKEEEARKMRQEKAALLERANLKRELDLNLLQQKNTEAIDEQREVFHDEKARTVDEIESKHRAKSFELEMRLGEIRRDLESKLTAAQDQHEKEVLEMRLDYDKRLRDQNRQSQRFMDERVKSYENQLKQQEMAFKEKERFLTEHYEEELDRIKLTHARLSEKKS